MKGRANYLCLHRSISCSDGARSGARTTSFLPIDPTSGRRRTETGDRAELEDLPEDLPFWNEVVGDRRDLPRHRVPALRRLLRHADAPARRRVRRRHRQSPPAVRRRGGAAERVRRSDSRRARRAISTKRTSSRTSRRSTSASPSATTASRISRATSSARCVAALIDGPRRAERARDGDRARCAITRATFFGELQIARASERRAARSGCATTASCVRRRARRRPRPDRRARRPRSDAGAARRSRRDDDAGARGRARTSPALGAPRRASCATTCGSCCAADDPAYVYFVEIRGRGVFLRASPIDVSRDRPRAAARSDAHDGADLGDADRRRLRSTTSAAGSASRDADEAAAAVGVRLTRSRRSSTCRSRCRDPRSPEFADGGRPRGDRDPEAHARPRVRAVHQLRDAARGAARSRETALDYPILVQGTAPRSALLRRSSARRRTRCCSRRPASGRAWTSSARR